MTFRNKQFTHKFLDLPELEATQTPEGRMYKTPSGVLYPSVTTVIYHRPNESLEAWRKRVGEEEANKISTKATVHGNAIHKLCEHYLLNHKEVIDSLVSKKRVQLSYLRPILNNIDNIIGIEQALWSDELKMAGRADCIGEYKGKKSVCDWKTSNKPKKIEYIQSYFIQGAAYSLMLEERTGEVYDNIVIVVYVESEGRVQIFEQPREPYIKALKELVESYWQGR